MGEYTEKGGYGGYNPNHTERAELDYYATPPQEVTNILTIEGLENNSTILEPCCGGGHMAQGIINYCAKEGLNYDITMCDLVDRKPFLYLANTYHNDINTNIHDNCITFDDTVFSACNSSALIYRFNFNMLTDLKDDYDYIIMNPPFKNIEQFVSAALPHYKKKLIMLARLKFVESKKRYEEIFSTNPPQRIYQYVDRIACYKNGDFTQKPNSIEAYAWFVWDKETEGQRTEFDWIRRV